MSGALATGLPAGWIELAAHRSDDQLRAYLDAQAAADGDPYEDVQKAQLVDACLRGRQVLAGMRWQHFGAIVTSAPAEIPEDDQTEVPWLPTVWIYGVGLVRVPPAGDLDPMGLAQRVLGGVSLVDDIATFQLDDGRDGVVLGLNVEVAPDPEMPDPSDYLPQLDLKHLGVWVCLLPVPGLPDHLGLTVGVAPNRTERAGMSYVASQIATSSHWVEDPSELSDRPIIIDTTGVLLPGGFPDRRADTGSGL